MSAGEQILPDEHKRCVFLCAMDCFQTFTRACFLLVTPPLQHALLHQYSWIYPQLKPAFSGRWHREALLFLLTEMLLLANYFTYPCNSLGWNLALPI